MRLLAAILVAVVLAGCGDDSTAGTGFVSGDGSLAVVAPGDRQPAPSITGVTMDGEPLHLADYRGDVVVLNVWASWCAPCRAEAPILNEVAAQYLDRGARFIGLNTRDSPAAARAFVTSKKVTFPSLVDADGRIQVQFADTLPPQAIPSTVVIDRQGRVAARALGKVSAADLRALIETLLAEPAA